MYGPTGSQAGGRACPALPRRPPRNRKGPMRRIDRSMLTLLTLLSGTLALAACDDSGTQPLADQNVLLERNAEITGSGNVRIAAPLRTAFAGEADWARFWEEVTRGAIGNPPPPAVDFGSHAVLLVAMGERAGGGFDIHIEQVISREVESAVRVILESPPLSSSCRSQEIVSVPFDAVLIPGELLRNPITFVEEHRIVPCP